jgi:DNA replication protein DnaC
MDSSPASCPTCGGAGWLLETVDGNKQARPCACRLAGIQREKLESAQIPERYRGCNLENFNERGAERVRAKQIATEFVEAYPAVDVGLLLIGPSGAGKTHLACAILSELILTKGVRGLYVDFSDLLLKIQSTFRPDADSSKEALIAPITAAEILVLDELGASRPHPWVLDVLYNLLNTRYNQKRITIATSNYGDELEPGEKDRLEDRLNYRLRSRLYEMCLAVPIRGDDYRKTVLSEQVRRSRF